MNTGQLTSKYRIKCHECDKNLVAARFSNNQLKKYQERIYKNGELKAERPRCQPCMGVATGDDKFCNDCGLYKGREEFSKSARKKGDNAVSTSSYELYGR